jgi:chromosome partitioning protein
MKGITIAIFNQKGGVAKTTSTINMGWSLISKKKKVLMLDFDPQGHLSKAMQIKPEVIKYTIYDVLQGTDIHKAMLTDNNNFYFLPCDINLSAADDELKNKQYTLQKLLEGIKSEFDYILIDCPPSLGSLSINALVASDWVLVPMATEYLAWCGFEQLMDTVKKVTEKRVNEKNEVQEALNPNLKMLGILATKFSKTRHDKEMLEVIQSTGKAFKTVISHSVKFKDSTVLGVPIMDYDKKLGKQYLDLAKEVIDREKGADRKRD